jgi:hypothetical protein
VWAGPRAAEGTETPWTEVQVGLSISEKMAYLFFAGEQKVTDGNLAFFGLLWSVD